MTVHALVVPTFVRHRPIKVYTFMVDMLFAFLSFFPWILKMMSYLEEIVLATNHDQDV